MTLVLIIFINILHLPKLLYVPCCLWKSECAFNSVVHLQTQYIHFFIQIYTESAKNMVVTHNNIIESAINFDIENLYVAVVLWNLIMYMNWKFELFNVKYKGYYFNVQFYDI